MSGKSWKHQAWRFALWAAFVSLLSGGSARFLPGQDAELQLAAMGDVHRSVSRDELAEFKVEVKNLPADIGLDIPTVAWECTGEGVLENPVEQFLPLLGDPTRFRRVASITYLPPWRGGSGQVTITARTLSHPSHTVRFTVTLQANAIPVPPPAVDLRAHLAFQPGTWRQHANDCYAWATQAALMCEMATHPAIRIRDQLTVNLWHSKYHPTPLKDASGKDVRPSNEPSCSLNMSTPTVLERSYNQWRMLMPASNPNGMAAPASGMAVGVNPHYRIKPGGFRLGTVDAPFKLTHVGIDLIKNKLSENKVIIYRPSDRAHFMAIVGYDATGADESKHSWLVLDSAGGAEPYRRIPIGGADFPPGGVIPVECSFDYIDKLELDLDPEGPPRAVKVTVPGGDDSVHLGGPLTLWAEAQGRGPMRYQWLKDGAPITGATGSTLEFPAFRPEDAGTYQVQVTNDWGPVRSRGKVFAPAQDAGGTRLFLSPKGALLGPGQALTIRATVGGDGRATGVAWRLGAGDPGSLEAQGPFTVVYRAPRDMQAGTRLHARVTAVTRGAAVETAAVLDIPLAKLAIHPGEALDARLLLDLARARRTAHGDPKFSKRCDMNKDGRVTKQDEIQFIRQLKENL